MRSWADGREDGLVRTESSKLFCFGLKARCGSVICIPKKAVEYRGSCINSASVLLGAGVFWENL